MSIYLFAALDTKGPDAAYVKRLIEGWGIQVTLVDTGCLGEATTHADITRQETFAAAGLKLADLREQGDRGTAVEAAARGATKLVLQAHARGTLQGVMALGGSAGTMIGTAAMRALPLGIPKLMASTHASGATRRFVGGSDIVMVNTVVDISGLNSISRTILAEAAAAMAGMVRFRKPIPPTSDRPMIAATMFGVTTPCIQQAQALLEEAGYEVVVFHATGTGGEAMEGMIRDGLFAGVLDLTTTELADELVGGTLSAGPQRLTAAGKAGVPQVISVGALDMVNFGPRETVPEEFRARWFHQHNPSTTLMRTTPDENVQLAREILRKAAGATGPTRIFVPLQGISALDGTGRPFDDPAARQALVQTLRQERGPVEVVECDAHINDASFAATCANALLQMIESHRQRNRRV